ncbi:hypothetical protein SaccyDRAFT_3797 [Saccharomonospora cyanea NA-134]|uniref:Uncharacterized protein n=2 Tax=Saccharomonospora cyanea TaxID=40989 RepID=H5XG42_9PSEU|nr:hypothetical protein SaccyDRAFT_3797 [Saccharomonospora cyanea NA-134]
MMPDSGTETAITLRFLQEAFADWKSGVDRRFDDVIARLDRVVAEFQTYAQEQGPRTTALEHRVAETEKDIAELQRLRERDRLEAREDRRTSTGTKVAIATALLGALVAVVFGVLNLTMGA